MADTTQSQQPPADRPGSSTPDLLDAPLVIRGRLSQRLPTLQSVVHQVAESLRSLGTYAAPSQVERWRPSLEYLVNQAGNDFLDLLFDCLHGRGRSAIRGARTLFELAVAARDISTSEELDYRYASHFLLGPVLFGRLSREADALSGTEQKEVRYRLDRLRASSQETFDSLLKEFGDRFPHDWRGESLRKRAFAHSLGDDYQTFYAWASVAAHGTSAGMFGHFRGVDGRPIYRLGPAVEACPTALIHGLDYFEMILDSYEPELPAGRDLAELRSALQALRGVFPDYRRAILQIDEELWPEPPSPAQVAIYGLGKSGDGGWFLFDTEREAVIAAEPLEPVTSGVMEGFARLRKRHYDLGVWKKRSRFPLASAGLVCIAVPDLEVQPSAESEWNPAGWLFPVYADGTSGPHAEFTTAALASGSADETFDAMLRDLRRGRAWPA
jgi:hypothetical protein